MRTVMDPYIMVTGSYTSCKDCALICSGKIVLKLNRGFAPINMVLVLIGFCHIFKVEYHPEVRDVMEFLQEKLLGISERKAHTMAYMNLLRAVSCLEAQVHVSQDDHNDDHSSDSTSLDPLETQFSIV